MKIYDIVIKNGTVINTENNNASKENIGIIKDKIAIITNENIKGNIEIEAKGLIVSPGFIDVHGHLDGHIESAKLSALQGITTSIGGNCGDSPIKIKQFFDEQDMKGFLINQAELIGQSISLRETVGVRSPYVAANDEEIAKMSALVEKAFEEGAIGMSLGLEYAPGSSTEEITEISRIAAKRGKIIPIHTNLRQPGDLSSLAEVIELAENTGAHILVSHFVYQYGTGLMTEALDMVEQAKARGVKISVDSGMYTDFATFIGSTIYDEAYIAKFGWKFHDMLVTTGKYRGHKLTSEIYKELRTFYPNDTVICFTGVKEEIYEALEKSYVMPSTDTGSNPKAHPQNAGTFPRFFRKMVRERNSISLIEAVKRCTLLPAKTFEFENKGKIKVGADADIVIFDIDIIEDKAGFLGENEPDSKPEGINYVIVNGELVVKEGDLVPNVLPGKTIRAL